MLHLGRETGSRTTATQPTDPQPPSSPKPPVPPAQGTPPCDLVTVPARQGLEAVDILRRAQGHEPVGPVLHDGTCDTLGFLVPPGTADAWDVPGSACTRTDGRGLRLPTVPPAAPAGCSRPPRTRRSPIRPCSAPPSTRPPG